jgi:rubrerythrin
MRIFVNHILLFLIILPSSIWAQEKTIQNLGTSYREEANAASLYQACSEQAWKESMSEVAILFMALSRAESIHAETYRKLLERAGQVVEKVNPALLTGNTLQNLKMSSNTERNIMGRRYPFYISDAKSEGQNDASKAMRWAMETEKKHFILLNKVLSLIESGNTKSLPKIYWVCPKCGNVYDVAKPESMCSLCGTSSSKFIKFVK